MAESAPPPEASTTTADGEMPRSGYALNEDWAATIVGLVLIALVLAGVIAKGMIP